MAMLVCPLCYLVLCQFGIQCAVQKLILSLKIMTWDVSPFPVVSVVDE
jgi:hypothetical protein